MHVKKITAQKQQKTRIKQIKEFEKQQVFILIELLQPIHDFKAE